MTTTGAPSTAELLVLHGLRVAGMASGGAVAGRYALPAPDVEELLLDYEATGLVTRVAFGDSSGWTLTDAGKVEDTRRVTAELADTGTRATVEQAHDRFVELNARFLRACTDWQLRPAPGDPLAANDHTDWRWDERVLDTFTSLSRRLAGVCATLGGALARFDGYSARFDRALARVRRGERSWVDRPELDSCHTVWIQLHEDLISTLDTTR